MKEFKKVTAATEIKKIYDKSIGHRNQDVMQCSWSAELNMRDTNEEQGLPYFEYGTDEFFRNWALNLSCALEGYPKAKLFYWNRGIAQ
tara:strand:+ start:302 stop:565 length:264 start_codon:yes stop_codon:yes gene_type:complete